MTMRCAGCEIVRVVNEYFTRFMLVPAGRALRVYACQLNIRCRNSL
jgi:hypothetical protein